MSVFSLLQCSIEIISFSCPVNILCPGNGLSFFNPRESTPLASPAKNRSYDFDGTRNTIRLTDTSQLENQTFTSKRRTSHTEHTPVQTH